MRRRNLLNLKQRPVMGTPQGGTVHHGGEWVSSHKLLLETVAVVGGVLLIILLAYIFQTNQFRTQPSSTVLTEAEYRALHSYDAIEELRAERLINPPLVADQSYDAIETMRAQRAVAQGDRSYDVIENLRANALINPLPAADHSYDAIEDIRANRDLDH